MSDVNVTQKMQEMISRLPRTDTQPYRSVVNPEYSQEHIALSLKGDDLVFALKRAYEAYQLAVSYRDFKVGAAVTGLMFNPSDYKIMTGVNVKPDEESNMNVHAEQVAMQKARDRKFDVISMVVVIGNTQSDKQSGHEMPTLHPCGICRGVMFNDPLIDNQATLFASALPDFSKIELYTLEALHAFHENQDSSGMTLFELPHLTLLDPLPENATPDMIYEMTHSDQAEADEDIWENSVGAHLTQLRLKLLGELGLI